MACSAQLESRKLLRQLSHQSSEGSESIVSEELELLRNVYFDELDISHTESGDVVLNYHITPSTADDKDRQFVYLDLTITLSVTYPNLKPEVHFGESRGLSDAHLRGISEGLHHKSLEHLGSPMIYELVEYAKDCLTDNNRPCGQCAICQFEFKETDDFKKTQCYHYFHLPCLVSYVEFFEHQQREGRQEECQIDLMLRKKPKQLECPVCREPIAMDTTFLEAIQGVLSSSAADNSEIFRPSKELQSWQVKMASLLRRQREKGGVIDPSGEDDVIDDSWVSIRREGDIRMEEQPPYQAQQQGRNKEQPPQQGRNKEQPSYQAQQQGRNKEQPSYQAQQQGRNKEQPSYQAQQQRRNKEQPSYQAQQQGRNKEQPSYQAQQQGRNKEQLSYQAQQQRRNKEQRSYQAQQQGRNKEQPPYQAQQQGRNKEQPSYQAQQQERNKEQLSYQAQQQGRNKEQLSYQAHQEGRNKEVGVMQPRSETATTHPIDIQSSDTSDTKEATSKSCQGSKNSVRDRHQRTRVPYHTHADSRPCLHSRPTESRNSRPLDEGPHSRPLDEGPHSRTLGEGPHSRLLGEGPHSRPLGESPHSTQLNKHPHCYRDRRPVNQVHKNSRYSAEMRQAGSYNSASGDSRRDRRYNPHYIQDENYHQVYSSRPKRSRDEHYHKQRDSKPKHVQEAPVGVQVISLNQEVKVVEGGAVTMKEETRIEDPPVERTCSREHGAKCRHLSSGRNAPRGSSHEARESGFHKNQWSHKRTEKRDRKGDITSMTEGSQEP